MECAYCGQDNEALTREHIWPRCIIERVQSYSIRYAARAKKIVRSDLTIRDVCQICNNGKLSKLDEYFCSLYDRYFNREISEGQPILFKYDFGKLARALLKISYNSARTTGIDSEVLAEYAPIITSDACPLGTFIKLVTIHPSQTLDHSGNPKVIPVRATRCGPIEIRGRAKEGLVARLIQVDGYRFYLIITSEIRDRPAAVRYLANEMGTWLPYSGEALVPFPTLSALSSFQGIEKWRK